jgi:hypothetical protein
MKSFTSEEHKKIKTPSPKVPISYAVNSPKVPVSYAFDSEKVPISYAFNFDVIKDDVTQKIELNSLIKIPSRFFSDDVVGNQHEIKKNALTSYAGINNQSIVSHSPEKVSQSELKVRKSFTKEFKKPYSFEKLVRDVLRFNGKGNHLHTFLSSFTFKDDHGPLIFWEEEMGIGLTTLSLDHKYYTGYTLWERYKKAIKKNPRLDINNYSFKDWFQDYTNILSDEHPFKKKYGNLFTKDDFKLIKFETEEEKSVCEIKIINGLLYVKGNHPNAPYDMKFLKKDIPKKDQWLLLDTTLLFTKHPLERKKYSYPGLPVNTERMLFVKDLKNGKTFCLFKQPCKVFHSSLVVDPEGEYDAGTFTAKEGQLLSLDNESGHIRPSKSNFLLHGLIKNLREHKALHHVTSLRVIHQKLDLTTNTLKSSEDNIKGNEAIKNYLDLYFIEKLQNKIKLSYSS